MDAPPDPAFEPYRPRPVSFLGVRDVRGYRLKVYAITHGDHPFDPAAFEPALALAAGELPQPPAVGGRPGVGFAVLHRGRTGDYTVLGWWDNENELPLRVFVRSAGGWRPAAGGESACVWDLRVVWHEREAYVATVLGGGRLADYLARTLDGHA